MNENHIGKRVKVFFRTGLSCEGIISKWEKNTAVLQATESNDVLYITDIKQDVMMVRFFLSSDLTAYEQVDNQPLPQPVEPRRQPVLKKAPPIKEPPPPEVAIPVRKQELRLKKLAELKQIQQQELKENIKNRVKSHVPTNIQRSTYAQPSFTKRIPKKHTTS